MRVILFGRKQGTNSYLLQCPNCFAYPPGSTARMSALTTLTKQAGYCPGSSSIVPETLTVTSCTPASSAGGAARASAIRRSPL